MPEESTRIPFGDYKPDLALTANNGLAVAKNTVPIPGGYAPIASLADVSGFSALTDPISARPSGAIAGITRNGEPYNFVGTETRLFAHHAATVDVTRTDTGATVADGGTAIPYNCAGQSYWESIRYKDTVIFVNPYDDPQYFNVGTSQTFKRLGNPDLTATVAPRAAHIGLLGSFVILGNTYDAVNGADPSAIHWSAVADPYNWPEPGTFVASAVQSDRQPLGGDGGAVQRVVSGAEVGAVFQERAIWRLDYRGGELVFELNRVEPMRGLLIPAIAVPFGRHVFYCAEDGFYLFDYTTSTPIGRGVIDQTFLSDIDTAYFDRVSAVTDPNSQRVFVLYPGAGNTAGTPNKFLCYDFVLQRFTHGELDATWITQVVAPGLHLDSPHTAADPDTDGVDGAGLPRFDDRIALPGALTLGAYSTTFQIQDFSGAGRAATLETARRELSPASRSLATSVRPLVDAAEPEVACAGLSRSYATPKFSRATRVDDHGAAPLRNDGRFHVFRVELPSGWDSALGMDVYFQRSGRR